MNQNTRAHLLYVISDFASRVDELDEQNRGDCTEAIKLRAAIKQLRLVLEAL